MDKNLETEYDGDEIETEELQDDPEDSPALQQGVDASKIKLLPGTGGPDDDGDVES
jgi:hypothetical protein